MYVRRLPPALPVILPLVRRVGIAKIVDRLCPMRERRDSPLSHGDCVEFLLLHLLQSAHRQPLYRLDEWAEAHSADRLYGCPPEAFNDDRFGRTLDALAPVIDAVQGAVVTAALQQFAVDVQALHWDLTHVTFAGAHEEAPLIEGGYGGGRLHEKQLKVSLHVTSDGGIPVRHQVLAGGAHQAPFAPAMLQALQAQLGRSDLIVISDSAGISYETIAMYHGRGAHFIAPLQLTPAEQQRLAAVPREAFTELEYRRPSAPDERYFVCDGPWTVVRQKHPEPLVIRGLLIYSTGRARRDAEDRARQLERCRKRLAQIQAFLGLQSRYRQAAFAQTQIDKAIPEGLREIVRCELRTDTKPFTLTFEVDEAALQAAARGDGRYVVATDQAEPSADAIFERYPAKAGPDDHRTPPPQLQEPTPGPTTVAPQGGAHSGPAAGLRARAPNLRAAGAPLRRGRPRHAPLPQNDGPRTPPGLRDRRSHRAARPRPTAALGAEALRREPAAPDPTRLPRPSHLSSPAMNAPDQFGPPNPKEHATKCGKCMKPLLHGNGPGLRQRAYKTMY